MPARDTTRPRHIWIQPRSADLIELAVAQGATALIPPDGDGSLDTPDDIALVARDGDFQEGRDFMRHQIRSEHDEHLISADKLAVIEPAEWTIIPAENLISRGIEVILVVDDAEQARLALTIMEQGVAGIWLRDATEHTIKAVGEVLAELNPEPMALISAEITHIQPVGIGDRCCLDLIGQLEPGEGLLVGSFNHARFLLHSENVENDFCASRPFRVNAGAVHGYVITPGDRIRYLAELTSGDPVLVVNADGQARTLAVGRNKIERRPMVRIDAKTNDGQLISAIVQHAETIRLVSPDGKPSSITTLNRGDQVLASVTQPSGRHFGRPVSETIQER